MRKIIGTAAVALAVLAPAACSSGSHGSTRSAAANIAANPTVKADEQAAAVLVQSCVTASSISNLKGCIEAKVPPASRTALKECLASAAASSAGKKGAKALFEQGAQACVATALK